MRANVLLAVIVFLTVWAELGSIKAPAEPGFMFLSENIGIDNVPSEPNEGFAIFDCVPFINCQRANIPFFEAIGFCNIRLVAVTINKHLTMYNRRNSPATWDNFLCVGSFLYKNKFFWSRRRENSDTPGFNDGWRFAMIDEMISHPNCVAETANCFLHFINNGGRNIYKDMGSLQGGKRIGAVSCRVGTELGNLKGFFFVSDSFPCAGPEQPSENPKPRSRNEQKARENGGPPFWRIPLALTLGLGANGAVIAGVLSDRRILGCLLCGLSISMFAGGAALLYSVPFPATWGW